MNIEAKNINPENNMVILSAGYVSLDLDALENCYVIGTTPEQIQGLIDGTHKIKECEVSLYGYAEKR